MIKQITIEEFLKKNKDSMKEGYITCDKDGTWDFWTTLPYLEAYHTYWQFNIDYITEESEAENLSAIFNIAPAEDWKNSLIKVGDK